MIACDIDTNGKPLKAPVTIYTFSNEYSLLVVAQNPRGQNPRGQNPRGQNHGGQNPSSKLRGGGAKSQRTISQQYSTQEKKKKEKIPETLKTKQVLYNTKER